MSNKLVRAVEKVCGELEETYKCAPSVAEVYAVVAKLEAAVNEHNDGVTIHWVKDDVLSIRPWWTEQQCDDALGDAAKTLRDRSTEEGWQILEDLIGWWADEEDGVSNECPTCAQKHCSCECEHTPYWEKEEFDE